MTAKQKKESGGTQFNITGGIHAGRDVIMGDQINQAVKQVEESQSPADFSEALEAIQKELATLKTQSGLNSAERRNLDVVESKVNEAAEKAAAEKPAGSGIQADLKEAQETMSLLTKGIGSAVQLGAALGNLAVMAMQVFGG